MTLPPRAQHPPISDHGAVGDLRSVALIAPDGSVDWCCLPHLAAPSVFGALLDLHRGGHFRVALTDCPAGRLEYLEDTNVLVTHWRSPGGTLRVTDFMPVSGDLEAPAKAPGEAALHRLLHCESGKVEVEVEWAPRLDYARGPTSIEPVAGGFLATTGAVQLALAGLPASARLEEGADGSPRVVARLRLRAGDQVSLVTRWGGQVPEAHPSRSHAALEETVRAWRTWLHKAEAKARRLWAGPWRDLVKRSELVLKLLTYSDTGAIAAAATTSLPETLGGVRNWDYRYAWIRDAGLTAQALTGLGHRSEAMRFLHWVEGLVATRERTGRSLQIMYGIHGEAELPEEELSHLSGYQGSRPVRIGNEAARQRQHDIYAELLTAAYELLRNGEHLEDGLRGFLSWTADEACRSWRDIDSGIWEIRGEPRHYTYSKVLSWAALDRALRLAQAGVLSGDVRRWRASRDEAKKAVLSGAWNEQLGSFTQSFDSPELDASNLLIPVQELLPAEDPRVQGTIDRTLEQLTVDGLVYRYRADDGLPGEEGAFGLTTFWLVDALALSGRREEAWRIFEGIARRASPLGLFSEQIDPHTGAFLGNFPQAFTHLGLINSTLYLAHAEGLPLPVPPLLGTPRHRDGPSDADVAPSALAP